MTRTQVQTSAVVEAATRNESERRMLRNHLFNTFQSLTDYLKDTYGDEFSYTRRYTHIGPRVARTKFYGANWSGGTEANASEKIVNSINTRYKGVMTAEITGPFNESVTVYLNS